MEKNSVSIPRCIARSEIGYFQTDKPFMLMNCLQAILQNDSREIFFLDSLLIKQWQDNMCLAGGVKSARLDTRFITVPYK